MNDDQAPATKQDVKMLMDSIGRLYDDNQKWKEEIKQDQEKWKEEIKQDQEKWKEEIKQYNEVLAEQVHCQACSANKDEIASITDTINKHDERITTLEKISLNA